MTGRVVIACLCVLLPSFAVVGRQAAASTRADSAADTQEVQVQAKAKLDATRSQVATEDAQVRQLRARVESLEANSAAATRAMAERDREIAELQKQLSAKQRP